MPSPRAPTPSQPAATSRPRFSDVIRARRGDILTAWEAAVRDLPAARRLDHDTLLDRIPDLLERIAQLVEAPNDRELPELPRAAAEQHALDRLDEGFDVSQVIAELALLRDALLRTLIGHAAGAGQLDELRTLDHAIDRAIAQSVARYVEVRDRMLQALERLDAAATTSTSLDELLERLLQVLTHVIPAVDTAAILLRDGDLLRARAVVGLDPAHRDQLDLAIGEGFAGKIAATGRPLMLRAASTQELGVHSEALRRRGIRALYGVPLIDNGRVVGVAHVGSITAHQFSDQDQRLVGALASKAAGAIIEQQLRDAAAARAGELALETERRRTLEDAVRASEARLRRIVDNAPIAICVTEPDGRCVIANPAAAEVLGLPPDAVVGRSVFDLLPADAAATARAEAARVLATGQASRREAEVARPDGVHTFLSIQFPIPGDRGETWIGAVAADITERKRAEDAQHFLHDASAAMAAPLEFGEAASCLARLAVPRLADGCEVEVIAAHAGSDQVAIEHTDPARRDRCAELRRRHPPTPAGLLGEVLAGGGPVLIEDVAEPALARLAPDEAHRDALRALGLRSILIVPMVARGRTIGAITLVTAESGRRFTARERALAIDLATSAALALDNARLFGEARDAVHSREDLLAVVSHDLKNPLGAIDLAVALLMQRPPSEPKAARQLEAIHRATQRMDRLITDLLDLASIQAGRLAIERKPEDAGALIGEAFDAHHPIARQAGLTLVRGPELPGVRVICDRGRVLQVFGNLLGNAIKFTRPGDTIRIAAEVAGGELRCAVADTGPGIPADELPHLFEPYWSGRRHAKHGTGLGLYISKGIVETHGGRMWATSAPGAGATFWFTLPLG